MTDVQTLPVDGAAVSFLLWLLVGLTHCCPPHYVFCYNPVDFARWRDELSTAQWTDVLRQACQLDAAQLGLSGGEPLLHSDLGELVAKERQLGFYANLTTSGIGPTEARLTRPKAAGFDHVQFSFQDSMREMSGLLSNMHTFDLKSRIALSIKQYDCSMMLNVVLHHHNLDHVEHIIEMAVTTGIEHPEFANTQYYGWGLINRAQLMSTREQSWRAEVATGAYRGELGNRSCILFVVPDYFESRLKACMSGWGAVFLAVTPDGTALPYHTAQIIPDLHSPNVADTPFAEIWGQSEAFSHFRGDAWMQKPCYSCSEKYKNSGGCCRQVFALTGDAVQADPVCDKSPHYSRV